MSGSSASAPGSTISSTLWAHLLNKDAGASGSGFGLKTGLTSAGLATSAPADRAGTSVRVLLHDTQATMERFSEKVDKLVSGAEDSHRKLLARNEEVSDEVERLVRRTIQEQVGRAETTLKACILESAQAPALAELRQSVSSCLDALRREVEAVRNLAHTNTQALQSIKDYQLQIFTAMLPLLPTLQKVPLCIAHAESNLKEAIRKSLVAPTIASIQPSTTSPGPSPRKRRIAEHQSPSPSVAKKRRIYADSGSTAQQLLSPKSSRDSLLTQGGNPDRRVSIQPPTPRIVPNTSSRMHPVTLLEVTGQPTHSVLPRKKETAPGISVAPCLAQPASNTGSATPAPSNHLNRPKDGFKAPDPPRVQTPLRTGPKHLSNWSARPSAPPLSLVGFSARRGRRFIPITNDDSDDSDDETFDD